MRICIIFIAFLSFNLLGEDQWRLRAVANPELISIQKAINIAEQRNIKIKRHKAEVAQAESKVWLSTSKLLPELSLSATQNIIKKHEPRALSGLFVFPLFDLRAAIENKASREALKAAQLSLNYNIEEVIHQVCSLYVEALLAQSLLAVAHEEHEKYLKQEEVIKRKVALGEARSLDLTNALYQSHKSMSDRILRERDYQRKLAELGNELALSEAFNIEIFDINSETLKLEPLYLQQLALSSFEIKALKKELSHSLTTKASEAWSFLPTLKASYEGSYHVGSSERSFSSELMLKFDLPLLSGGSSLARLKEHQAQVTINKLNLRQKEAEKDMGVYGALDQINAYQRAQESSKLALDAAEQAAKSAERLFARGELTALALIDANAQLFGAKYDLIDAKLKLMQSQLSLLFLTGRLKDLREG